MSKQGKSWILKDWKVYPKLNLIQNHKSEFSVKPRLMKLLEFFLLNQNEVVTKEAILDFVWEDRIVTENLLTKSISELRKLLEERFPEELEIETIRNVGYRFNPGFDISPDPAREAPPLDKKEKKKKKRILWLLLLGGILLSTFMIGFFDSVPEKEYQFSFERITSLKGQELMPAISPDGENIAFAWREKANGLFHIYVRPLHENNPRKLTSAFDTEYDPAWSPDGNYIAFMRKDELEGLKLIKKSVIGGDEMILSDLEGIVMTRDMIWAKDENLLVFSARTSSETSFSLYAFDIKNAVLKQLTRPGNRSYGDVHPSCTKVDHHLAFIRVDNSKAKESKEKIVKSTLLLLDLNNLKTTEITTIADDVKELVYHSKLDKYLCWVSADLIDNRFLGIDEKGNSVIYHRVKNGMPGRGALGMNDALYYEFWQSNLNVDQYTLESARILSDSKVEYLDATVWDWGLRFASESEEMAFISFRSGDKEIWTGPTAEPEKAHQITNFKNTKLKSLSISPDGQNILFLMTEKEQSKIYTIQTNGQNLHDISDAGTGFTNPEWSVDGQSIYYGSNQSGKWNIWKKDFKNEGEATLLKEGGFAVLSATFDKDHLYYTNNKLDTIFRMNLETGKSEALTNSDGMEAGNWVVVSSGIYYLAWDQRSCYLKFFDFFEKATYNVKQMKSVLPSIPSLSISNDGQYLFIANADGVNADIKSMKIE